MKPPVEVKVQIKSGVTTYIYFYDVKDDNSNPDDDDNRGEIDPTDDDNHGEIDPTDDDNCDEIDPTNDDNCSEISPTDDDNHGEIDPNKDVDIPDGAVDYNVIRRKDNKPHEADPQDIDPNPKADRKDASPKNDDPKPKGI